MSLSFKAALKKVFPLALLRTAQYEIQKVRSRTTDKWLFPERIFAPADYVCYRRECPLGSSTFQTQQLDPRLRQHFEAIRHAYTQDEYVLVYPEPCVIEPRQGWAMSADNRLIYPSLGLSREAFVHKPDRAIKRQRHRALPEYAELISLRDTGEENYFHFFNDILPKLFLLDDELSLSHTIPILVGRRLYERSYFQQLLAHPYLRDRTWIVQDEQYVRSHKTYFCKPQTHRADYYSRALALLPPAWLRPQGPDARLFITRNPRRLRFLENDAQVRAACAEYGFETIDLEELSFAQQVQTLARASFVVGIHGAGLTNIFYRGRRPLGLLELYPPTPTGYYPFHYALLAQALGYYYDGQIGLPGQRPFSGGFRVDIAELRQRLAALVAIS